MTKKKYDEMHHSERKIICTPGFIAKPLDDSIKVPPTHEALIESENYSGDYPKNIDFSKSAKMVIAGCRTKEAERTNKQQVKGEFL